MRRGIEKLAVGGALYGSLVACSPETPNTDIDPTQQHERVDKPRHVPSKKLGEKALAATETKPDEEEVYTPSPLVDDQMTPEIEQQQEAGRRYIEDVLKPATKTRRNIRVAEPTNPKENEPNQPWNVILTEDDECGVQFTFKKEGKKVHVFGGLVGSLNKFDGEVFAANAYRTIGHIGGEFGEGKDFEPKKPDEALEYASEVIDVFCK